ncbi:D-alanyl-D-alanine carboxypeptidase [Bacillus luteolus]|uniref:serine-type D-Ala-D-Ala carboxypeptidase n=1 Tax=Litchfieldia luteola TaxID=682179 RepID=A0ABR9QPN7_9BACI|nr:D-alanyl-D-alanine carboxypeptidase family protein [Cytobacillus luteolus]MBE4910366.1 D-alanyl-D-alanine carboxypeptidase [Cytobacillus luteolus]MBP1942059.1 D-alanyl-D-alanine carboxypeptidase (penicillin-binding protein 5/6) [Cytobacillus luteolus]
MKRLLTSLLFISLIVYSSTPFAFAEENTSVDLAPQAKSAILIERDTGAILYDKNSHEKLPPASMTKIMTMVLIMEAIDKGNLTWEEKIRTSEHAASMGGSQIFLEAGEEMTTEEMMKGIAIASGNDASVAMAERLAGSEEAFVEMMNKKAEELGLKNTVFKNPTGLPAEGHYSTAHDMAMMAKELLKYEGITKFTGKYEDYLRNDTDKKFWLVNTNRLVKFYPGVDGVKTGFTSEAKYCLTATAQKNNMRLISVVFGAPTPKDRNAQITKMLDYGFSQYKTHPMYERNQVVSDTKVSKGSKKKINLVTSEQISVLTKKGENIDDVVQEVVVDEKINAPIKKGDKLGTLLLKKNDKVISESPLIAEEDIDSASWWKLFKRTVGSFTKSE